jgi:uncharacterized protein (TIGR02996 family)
MASDESAMLAAIRAAPDDDAPRLVYADWLEEHGQTLRAHLIRGQIAGKWFGLKPRGLRIMFPYVNVNTPIRLDGNNPMNPLMSPGRGVYVRRGFIDEVRVRWATWIRIGPEIVAYNPVRYVGIRGVGLESSRDGDTPREDVLWTWEGLPRALTDLVPTTWIARNTISPAVWRTHLSDVIIALSRNDYKALRKLPRWGPHGFRQRLVRRPVESDAP